jgi:hypothetical protein
MSDLKRWAKKTMKHITLLLLSFIFASSISLADPSAAEVLSAIERFDKNAVTVSTYEAAPIIIKFAEESEDVNISIGAETAPWIDEKWKMDESMEETIRGMILAAYIGGNVRSQILSKKNQDDPHSGWLLVLSVYDQFRTKIDFRSPAIERLRDLQAKGLLKEHARKCVDNQK